jgi:hypothetical protein
VQQQLLPFDVTVINCHLLVASGQESCPGHRLLPDGIDRREPAALRHF